MEQSFNYNVFLVESLSSLMALAQYRPFRANLEMWESEFGQMVNYRDRFLSTLVMPDGRMVTIGTANNLVVSTNEDGLDKRIQS